MQMKQNISGEIMRTETTESLNAIKNYKELKKKDQRFKCISLFTEISSDLQMYIPNKSHAENNKQTNKTPQMYISKAGCCLDDGLNQNE